MAHIEIKRLEMGIPIKKCKHKYRWEITEGLNQITNVRIEKKVNNLGVRRVREREQEMWRMT